MAVSPNNLEHSVHLLHAAEMQILGAVLQFQYQSPALGFGDVKAAFSYVLLELKPVHFSLHFTEDSCLFSA